MANTTPKALLNLEQQLSNFQWFTSDILMMVLSWVTELLQSLVRTPYSLARVGFGYSYDIFVLGNPMGFILTDLS